MVLSKILFVTVEVFSDKSNLISTEDIVTKAYLPYPEYKNLETTPKILKVGAIFIRGPFFLDFTFFNAVTVHCLRN